jgi:Raf kinase inhibitor-like YbhB/YbcL family protein
VASAVAVVAAAFVLRSPAFKAGGAIPRAFTCDGRDVSPPLRWTAPPPATRSFSLAVFDVDAGFVHWRLRAIPARARGLVAGSHVGVSARNSFGRRGYGGPCPPPGAGRHRYVFTLRALAAGGRVLGSARLVGRYGR